MPPIKQLKAKPLDQVLFTRRLGHRHARHSQQEN